MKRTLPLALAFALYIQPAFALFCPNGFNQINMGDTIEQVQQQCGKPDAQNSSKAADENAIPQQWEYYISAPRTAASPIATTGPQPTLKMTIAFAGGKAVNMSVAGTNVVGSGFCKNKPVKLGSTMDEVKAACGAPGFINKQQSDPNSPPPMTETTIFKYNGTPSITLTFTNGKLTKRE